MGCYRLAMRLVFLLTGFALGGCLVPIEDVEATKSHVGAGGKTGIGGGAGVPSSVWDAGEQPAAGGTGGQADSGSSADAGADSSGDAAVGGCAALGQFADDFDDGVPAPFWLAAPTGGAAWDESGGRLNVLLPHTLTANTFAGYRLEQGFDLKGCALSVRVVQAAVGGMAVYTHFWLSYGAAGVAEISRSGEGMWFTSWQSGTAQVLNAVGYNPTQHAYWRFRHDGTTLSWETSPDASQWTVQASAPLPSKFSALRIGAGATFDKTLAIAPTASFDDFAVSP
jgi:hypothetical protein